MIVGRLPGFTTNMAIRLWGGGALACGLGARDAA